MKIVVQRVLEASCEVNKEMVSSISRGFLLLVAIEKEDTVNDILWCANKVSGLRIFDDENGLMNLNLQQVDGEVLSISQFTLAGDVRKGNRPSFTNAQEPNLANEMFNQFNEALRENGLMVKEGVFQAEMKIHLVNDGPVTLIIESKGR